MPAALLLAFGPLPPDTEIGGAPLLRWIVQTLRQAGLSPVVVVSPDGGAEKLAAHMDAVFLRSPAKGAVQAGLAYLRHSRESVLLADMSAPLVGGDTLRALLEAPGPAFPTHRGQPGQLWKIDPPHFEALLRPWREGGLSEAFAGAGIACREIPVEDEGILPHSPEKLNTLAAKRGPGLRPEVRLRVSGARPALGPGCYQLLRLTQEAGSLREACRRMGISYSKGWKILSQAEKQLGYALLLRSPGGKTGGQSALTPEAVAVMEKYAAFCADVNSYIQAVFPKYFGED